MGITLLPERIDGTRDDIVTRKLQGTTHEFLSNLVWRQLYQICQNFRRSGPNPAWMAGKNRARAGKSARLIQVNTPVRAPGERRPLQAISGHFTSLHVDRWRNPPYMCQPVPTSQPQSTGKSTPVIALARSDSKNVTASPTCSGLTSCPSGELLAPPVTTTTLPA
jgi:hypothetical protein